MLTLELEGVIYKFGYIEELNVLKKITFNEVEYIFTITISFLKKKNVENRRQHVFSDMKILI